MPFLSSRRAQPRKLVGLPRKIFQVTSLTTLVIFSLTSGLSIHYSRKALMAESTQHLIELVDALENSLILAAWQINTTNMQVMLNSILSQPSVLAVRYTDTSMNLQMGLYKTTLEYQNDCPSLLERDYTEIRIDGQRLGSGQLSVCFNQEALSNLSFEETLRQQGSLLVAVSLTALIVSLLLTRILVAPLRSLTNHLNSGKSVLSFSRSRGKVLRTNDEIDQLIEELKLGVTSLNQERMIVDASFPEVRDAIVQTDAAFNIQRSNRRLEEITGKAADEQALNLSDYFPAELLSQACVHSDIPGPKGRLYEIRVVAFGEPSISGYLYVIADRTELIEHQNQEVHRSRMQALGTLASGVAHDFNNILAGILASAELLRDDTLRSTNKAEKYISLIISNSQRGASLSNQLLMFARKVDHKMSEISAIEAANNSAILAAPLLGKSVRLETHFDSQASVVVDPGLLDSALMNLLINARDALSTERAGHVVLSVFERTEAEQTYVVFSIQDNGIGMSKSLLDRVKEPFFTTKGHGNGLGVSMVSGFAEQSGGELRIRSTPDVGTIVELCLPRKTAQYQPPSPAHEATTDSQSADTTQVQQHATAALQRVLVIEDEAALQEMFSLTLKRRGFQVEAAKSLQDVQDKGYDKQFFHLVVCDVVLEHSTFMDVFEAFRAAKNRSRFVMISGNFPQEFEPRISKLGSFARLEKPFKQKQLLEFVNSHILASTDSGKSTNKQLSPSH